VRVEIIDDQGRTSKPVQARSYSTIVQPVAGPSGVVNSLVTGIRIPLRALRGVDAHRPRAIRVMPRTLVRGRGAFGPALEHTIVRIDDLRFTR
jgi:hypothetical protein